MVSTSHLMKRRNTVIVQEPYLQDYHIFNTQHTCSNEYFPEKTVDIVYDKYLGSHDVTDEENFDKSELQQEDASADSDIE